MATDTIAIYAKRINPHTSAAHHDACLEGWGWMCALSPDHFVQPGVMNRCITSAEYELNKSKLTTVED